MPRNRNKANPPCSQCSSKNTIKRGKYGEGIQQFSCLSCGKKFSEKTSLTYKTKEKIKEMRVKKVSFYRIGKELEIHRDTAKKYWNKELKISKAKEIPYSNIKSRAAKRELSKIDKIYNNFRKAEVNSNFYPNINWYQIYLNDVKKRYEENPNSENKKGLKKLRKEINKFLKQEILIIEKPIIELRKLKSWREYNNKQFKNATYLSDDEKTRSINFALYGKRYHQPSKLKELAIMNE